MHDFEHSYTHPNCLQAFAIFGIEPKYVLDRLLRTIKKELNLTHLSSNGIGYCCCILISKDDQHRITDITEAFERQNLVLRYNSFGSKEPVNKVVLKN